MYGYQITDRDHERIIHEIDVLHQLDDLHADGHMSPRPRWLHWLHR